MLTGTLALVSFSRRQPDGQRPFEWRDQHEVVADSPGRVHGAPHSPRLRFGPGCNCNKSATTSSKAVALVVDPRGSGVHSAAAGCKTQTIASSR